MRYIDISQLNCSFFTQQNHLDLLLIFYESQLK